MSMAGDRQEILDGMLKIQYQQFKKQPHNHYIHRQTVIGSAEEGLSDIDEDEIAKSWPIFKDKYVRPRPTKNSDFLNLRALERLSEIGEDDALDDGLQDEIVDYLLDAYYDDPTHPEVGRDDFLNDFDESELELDENVYALKLKGWVETDTHVGIGNAGYRSVELTDAARSRLV